MKSIDQVFGIAFKKDLEKLKHLGYKPRGKFIDISTPIKMIFTQLKDKMKKKIIPDELSFFSDFADEVLLMKEWFKLEVNK